MACRVLKNKNAVITSKFGYRTHPVTGVKQSFHSGVDIVGDGYVSDYIVAHTSGIVDVAKYSSTAGNYVAIRVSPTCVMRYLHMRDLPTVKVGQRVEKGDVLGYMGTTGSSTGVHLHFDISENGQYVDPAPYLYEDYLEEEDEDMTIETFTKLMNEYLANVAKEEPSAWAVSSGSWEAAKDKKLLDGTRPLSSLTRQEFAEVLMRLGLID